MPLTFELRITIDLHGGYVVKVNGNTVAYCDSFEEAVVEGEKYLEIVKNEG